MQKILLVFGLLLDKVFCEYGYIVDEIDLKLIIIPVFKCSEIGERQNTYQHLTGPQVNYI